MMILDYRFKIHYMKKCFKCGVVKELSDFYKHKGMADGHLNKCIECAKNDVENRFSLLIIDPVFQKSERDRHRTKYHRLQYRDKHKPTPDEKRKIMDTYKEKYPEKTTSKVRSHNVARKLSGMQLHHWSYNPEHSKDVIELSIPDHNLLHRMMKYDQGFKMYRRLDTNELLDTKDKHLQFLFHVILNEVLQ